MTPSPVIVLAIPAITVLLILGARRLANVREAISVISGCLLFWAVCGFLPQVREGGGVRHELLQLPLGMSISLQVDPLGLAFALVASFLWVVTTFYGIGYMRAKQEGNLTRFAAYFALAITAAIGVAFSANLFTLYLFYELLSLSTWPLVTHHGDKEAMRGGRKYLGYLLGSSILLAFPAMLYLQLHAGTLDFVPGGVLTSAEPLDGGSLIALTLLLVYGLAKCALIPLHGWLPAAMVAPTPVSALLHAVAVVKVGVFSVLRVLHHLLGSPTLAGSDAATLLVILACTTILLASLLALAQDNLKRMLAYSTVSQLSYIILGGAMFSSAGLTASTLHIAMHAFGKITLFFCAGAIYVATGKKEISQLDGIGRRMPWTMGAFFVASLSIIGLPPLGGFHSKWMLGVGALESGQGWIIGVLLVSSLLAACYLLPVVIRAFFKAPPAGEETAGIQEAPMLCVLPLCATALVSVLLFFFPHVFYLLGGGGC